MSSPAARERLVLLAIGVLVLIGPVVILALTIGLLIIFGGLTLQGLTLVEFLELYLIELALFAGLAYGVYRLTLWLVEIELPASLDALDDPPDEETDEGGSQHTNDR